MVIFKIKEKLIDKNEKKKQKIIWKNRNNYLVFNKNSTFNKTINQCRLKITNEDNLKKSEETQNGDS